MIQSVCMSDAGGYSVIAGASMSKAHLTVEGKDVCITEPAENKMTVNINITHFIYRKKNNLFLIHLNIIDMIINF